MSECWKKPTKDAKVQLYEHTHGGEGAIRILREPVGSVYYHASAEYLKMIGWGRHYFLMFWRDTEQSATTMAEILRKKRPEYGFVVQKIPFMRGDEAIVRFGVYTTYKVCSRYPYYGSRKK